MSIPPVAVAVVSWNTCELLRECLGSLTGDAEAGLAEVWVFDNASADGSAGMVAELFPWVRLVAGEENLGFGRAVNEVARRTQTEWIVSANADIELEPGSLAALVDAGGRYPQAGILAPQLIGSAGATQQSVHAFPGLAVAAVLAAGLPGLSPGLGDRFCIDGWWDPERPRTVDWAHGAFLLCRREAFDEVGGFDDRQWMYAEDLDLAWRTRRAGWTVRYVPGSRIRHAGAAATTQAFGDDVSSRFMTATFAWMADRRGLVVTYMYASLNLAGALARWLGYSFLALLRPARFGPPRDAARSWIGLHRKGLARRSELMRRR